MQKDILSNEVKKLIIYILDNNDFKEAPDLLNLSSQKFKELVINKDELFDKFDSSNLSQAQKLLISTYLHLYAALNNKNLKTSTCLIKLRKVLNINDEYIFSIFNALKLINPKALLNGRKPLECIINPIPEISAWASNVVYRFLQDGRYIKKIKISNLNKTEYEHPLDKKALSILKKTPGLDTLVKQFNKRGIEKILKFQITGSNIKVTKTNYPEIYKTLERACEILDCYPIPELYVQIGFINAYTVGVENPIIVITSGCIGLLSYDELLCIIAHEVGHIKSQHVLYYQISRVIPTMGNLLSSMTLGFGNLISHGLQIPLLNWQRKAELTSDRAGLLACQNIEAATTLMMKIAGAPPKYYSNLKAEDFKKQSREFEKFDEDNLDKVAKGVSVMFEDHPWTVMRGHELYKWIDSGQYNKVIERNIKPNNKFLNSDYIPKK